MIVLLFAFSAFTASAQKKVKYEFPDAMREDIKAEYLKQCEKGKVLYDINCSKCHNITVRRKPVIPDFTEKQLINYELRILNPNHESDMPETKVTAEELGLIITFLTYKAKNK